MVTDPLTVLFGLKVCDDGAPILYPASLPFHFLFAQLPFCLELWCVLSFIRVNVWLYTPVTDVAQTL